MMTVTTQAPNNRKRPSGNQSADDHIKRLKFDLAHHAGSHTMAEVFDADCAECIYWAVKIVQNPEVWDENYREDQRLNLLPVPFEVANYAVKKINDSGYGLNILAHEMDVQEYLQVVAL